MTKILIVIASMFVLHASFADSLEVRRKDDSAIRNAEVCISSKGTYVPFVGVKITLICNGTIARELRVKGNNAFILGDNYLMNLMLKRGFSANVVDFYQTEFHRHHGVSQ